MRFLSTSSFFGSIFMKMCLNFAWFQNHYVPKSGVCIDARKNVFWFVISISRKTFEFSYIFFIAWTSPQFLIDSKDGRSRVRMNYRGGVNASHKEVLELADYRKPSAFFWIWWSIPEPSKASAESWASIRRSSLLFFFAVVWKYLILAYEKRKRIHSS